jgi:hypothetical protein
MSGEWSVKMIQRRHKSVDHFAEFFAMLSQGGLTPYFWTNSVFQLDNIFYSY